MDENDVYDAPTVTLTDDNGLKLDCYVEQSIELDDREYVLLLPVDAPIEIFAWREEGEEDEAAVLVEDPKEIEQVFRTAKAVLGEQNLTLKQTAVVLTVEGDLPEFDEELEADEEEEEEDQEELQLIASFYHDDQEYAIYTPLDPYFILAKVDDDGQPQILSPEELKRLEPLLPMLEDQLFDELE
jgi:Protein of unknown function (DUF3727)/Protein of unknown function (DUF1292)